MRGAVSVISMAMCVCVALPTMAQSRSATGFEPTEGFAAGSLHRLPDAGATRNRWTVANPAYDVVLTPAAAHTGSLGLRWSNRVIDLQVQGINSPRLNGPAGEPGTQTGEGSSPDAGIGRAVQQFAIRSVSTSADPGRDVNVSIDDGAAGRQSIIAFREIAGALRAQVIYQVGVGDPNTRFVDVPGTLTWGQWYSVKVELDMKPGPLNDVVRVWVVPDGQPFGAPSLVTTSYEEYYRSLGQQPVAVNGTSMRLSQDAGGAAVQGVYFDDLSLEMQVLPPDPPDAGLADAGNADGGFGDGGSIDAGAADAGVTDAGLSATDAGSSDGGVVITVPLVVGCGCQGAGTQAWAFAFALLLVGRGRRH